MEMINHQPSSNMNRAKDLAERLEEIFLNGRWIANTNFYEQLSQTGFEEAITKVATLNSIAALTFHVNYYLGGLIEAFRSGSLDIHDRFSFDLPYMESAHGWIQLVKEFEHNAKAFANIVRQTPDARLDEIFIDKKYGSFHRNIEGMIEHGYYHLGQVVLLRKWIASKDLSD